MCRGSFKSQIFYAAILNNRLWCTRNLALQISRRGTGILRGTERHSFRGILDSGFLINGGLMTVCKENRKFIILAIIFLLSPVFISSCKKDDAAAQGKEGSSQKKTSPVSVADAVIRDVPVQINAIGNIQAYANVSIKSQVEGEITAVHFREGQEVNAGDSLFTIDSRMYETQLKQAEASLSKNRIQLLNTKKQLERYASVLKKGITEEQYDNLSATAASLEAGIKADEALIEAARLKVSYCAIKAPVSGITGSLKVSKGNIVKANDNEKPLVSINQIRPVYAVFSVPERNLSEIRVNMSERELDVTAVISGNEKKTFRGSLSFIENSVDVATGSILMKASFPNKDAGLWPGQFVNITLGLGTRKGAVTIPSQAVLAGQNGEYVLVVKNDETVEFRNVKTGTSINGETVINEGIQAGEKVITDGQMKLSPGSRVKIAGEKDRSDQKKNGNQAPLKK